MPTLGHTPDGRYVVVEGRRWRATDPTIDTPVRKALVDELMAARRAVGGADDAVAERVARDRVQDAKVALGERGQAWWEEPDPEELAARREAAERALARVWDEARTGQRVQEAADHVVDNLPAEGVPPGPDATAALD